MARGRPRKPIEQMKLEGTYRAHPARYKEREKREKKACAIVSAGEKSIPVPKTICEKKAKKFFKATVEGLQRMGLLSEADLPEIEQMCIVLQELKKVNEAISGMDVIENIGAYNSLVSMQVKLTNAFSALAMKYYISPKSRSSIVLDILEIEKKKNEAEKAKTPIQSIIAAKEN